jgi:PKD domain
VALRRLTAALAVLVTSLAGAVAAASPAGAVQTAQASIVSANPADFTPNVLDGQVNAIVQIGNEIVIGGTFTQVQQVGAGQPVLTRDHVAAFDASTGVVSSTFAPAFDGVQGVLSLLPAADGTSLYVGGDFDTLNGSPTPPIVRLDLSTGLPTAGFQPPGFTPKQAQVNDMRLVRGQLVIAGEFTKIGALVRGQMASLDADNGAVTAFLSHTFGDPINGGSLGVRKIDATPDGSRLLGIGDFTTVDGQSRPQIFLLDTSGSTAVLSSWQTSFFNPTVCSTAFQSYMRDLDIAPDGSYAVVSTTGAWHGPTAPCDTQTRWELNTTAAGLQPTWTDETGGDTTYAVAVTGTAVYVGGHQRWENNPLDHDAAGPGAVPRQGLAALDPLTGLPFSWNPGRDRGEGVFDMLATSTGLWIGSDTNVVGGETHDKLAYFPLAGGTIVPPNLIGVLPDDVYLLGQPSAGGPAADGVRRQFWLGSGAPEATANLTPNDTWSASRGSFLVDGTVYSGWSDGTFRARSFDGTTFGAPTTINTFASTFNADVPTITGMAYTTGRVYYTLAGDAHLYWRAFTPQDQVVGALRYTVAGTVSSMNPARVKGMFISGSSLYFADATDGHLYTITLSGASVASPGTIIGAVALADSSMDWRANGDFVWNGAPATHTNVPPHAVASATCAGNVCSFTGSGSTDPDGHVVSYAWSFGDSTTGSGATTSHAYSAAGPFTATLTVMDNAGGADATTVLVDPAAPPVPGSSYTALTPCRVFDTRSGLGTCAGVSTPEVPAAPIGATGTLSVQMTGVAGVPGDATAVVLNVTAVDATGGTFVTVYPDGVARPVVSNLNVANGLAVPNLVVVQLGSGGNVDFYNDKGSVNLIADVAGYFSPSSSSRYTPMTPCRVFDSRTGTGVCAGVLSPEVPRAPMPGGSTMRVKVTGLAGVPSNATAVVLNVTAVNATKGTFVTVYPDGVSRPAVSNLNVANGLAVPNLVVVRVGAGGYVDFFNNTGTVNLVADLAGYFASSTGGTYTALTPCRVFDTRSGLGVCSGVATPEVPKAPVGAAKTLRVKVTGVAGVPAGATAVVLNVTAVNATTGTFVTVYPDGVARPGVSNLNVANGLAVPNLVMVQVGAGGYVDFYNNAGSVNLIADIAGYVAP